MFPIAKMILTIATSNQSEAVVHMIFCWLFSINRDKTGNASFVISSRSAKRKNSGCYKHDMNDNPDDNFFKSMSSHELVDV